MEITTMTKGTLKQKDNFFVKNFLFLALRPTAFGGH